MIIEMVGKVAHSRPCSRVAVIVVLLLELLHADRGKLQPTVKGDATFVSLARHGNSDNNNAILQVGAHGRSSLHRGANSAKGHRERETDGSTTTDSGQEAAAGKKSALDETGYSMLTRKDLMRVSKMLEDQQVMMNEELRKVKARAKELEAQVQDHTKKYELVRKLLQESDLPAPQEAELLRSSETLEAHPYSDEDVERYRAMTAQTSTLRQNNQGRTSTAYLQTETSQNNLEDDPPDFDLPELDPEKKRKVINQMLLTDRKGKAVLSVLDALKMKIGSMALKLDLPLEANEHSQFADANYALRTGYFASPVFSALSTEEFNIIKAIFRYADTSGDVQINFIEMKRLMAFTGWQGATDEDVSRMIKEARSTMNVIGATHELTAEEQRVTFPEFVRYILPDVMLMHLRM